MRVFCDFKESVLVDFGPESVGRPYYFAEAHKPIKTVDDVRDLCDEYMMQPIDF